jgi:hypothetical protein
VNAQVIPQVGRADRNGATDRSAAPKNPLTEIDLLARTHEVAVATGKIAAVPALVPLSSAVERSSWPVWASDGEQTILGNWC